MSIFDLKTSVEELSSANQGSSRMEYDQHPPTRDITTTNFPNGAIHFRFQTSGQKRWCPSRSYIRIRASLTKANGTQLTTDDDVAPNMGLCASLFQSAEFRINDKTISRISDFMPQVDAIETRLTKSRSWLNGIGKSVNMWSENFNERLSIVSSDAVEQKNNIKSVKSQNALGYPVDTLVEIAADTGILTFSQGPSGAALPDATTLFNGGDIIRISSNVGELVYNVAEAQTATTLLLNNAKQIALANANHDFSRERAIEENISRKVKSFELIWQPPLSIFKINEALPSGKYELVLNPQTSSVYQTNAIQSLLSNKVADTDFKFEVEDMYLYCNSIEGPRADDITYLLDLEQTNCQSDNVPGTDFAQRNFDVSPSTYALSVAYQDSRITSDTTYSQSQFKAYGDNPINGDEDLKLNRFFINYAGQNLPAPDADPKYIIGLAKDYTTQRYAETQIYSGAMFDTGGAESLEEWQTRGPYYYFSWPRDGTDRSTRVNVHQGFENGTKTNNMRVLLFAHSKQVARIRVQDGRVIDVQLEDA